MCLRGLLIPLCLSAIVIHSITPRVSASIREVNCSEKLDFLSLPTKRQDALSEILSLGQYPASTFNFRGWTPPLGREEIIWLLNRTKSPTLKIDLILHFKRMGG